MYSIMNAIISGIAMSSYFTLKGVDLFNPLIILIIFGAVMLLDYILMSKVKSRKPFIKLKIILLILVLLGSVIIWVALSSSYGSALTFMTIILLSFNVSSLILIENIEVEYTDLIGLASLFMFGGILACVLIAVSEGEALDLLTFDSWGKNKRKINN